MRRASPPLGGSHRAIPTRQRLLFAMLVLVCFLLGFSMGEGHGGGLRPVDGLAFGSTGGSLGVPEGPLELTVFVDYSTPLALRTHRVLDRVRRAYGERVVARVRLLPDRASASSWLAHSALAAGEVQGLGEGRRESLVRSALDHSRQHLWSDEWVSSWAQQLSLGPDALRQSLQSAATARILARDRGIAHSYGVRRAPAIVVEGRRLEGPVPYEVLREHIDERLARRPSLSI